MLDMGFIRDIRKILAVLPPKRQNLLFSATFSDDITQLADGLLHQPGARPGHAPQHHDRAHRPARDPGGPRAQARPRCASSSPSGRVSQALVFTRTKHGANRLAEQLRRDGIEAAAIHGNRSQSQRVKALATSRRAASHPRRHRHRGPRPGHRAAPARRQLRAADGPRGLRPPHRPDRSCGRRRPGDLARVRGRGAAAARDPGPAQARDPVRDDRRLRAGPPHPARADPPAVNARRARRTRRRAPPGRACAPGRARTPCGRRTGGDGCDLRARPGRHARRRPWRRPGTRARRTAG